MLSYSEGSTLLVGTRIVSASGKVSVQARQNLNILSAENSSLVENTYKSWSMVGNSSTYAFNHKVKDQTLEFGTTLTGAMLSGDTVELGAGGNVHVVGATVVGPHGASVLGGGWVAIEAGLENHTSTHAHQESGHGYGVVKTDGRVHYVGANENQEKQNLSATSVTPVLTTIDSAQGAVTISGGQDVTLQGTKIDALQDVNLSAGNRLTLRGIYSGESSSDEREKGTFICKMRDGTGLEMQTWTVVPGSIQARGNLRLSAGQGMELGAVNLQTGGAAVFNTPEVKFVGEKNSDYLSRKVWDRDRGYEVNKGNGHVDETLTLTRTTIDARGGIQLPGSTRVSVAFDEHVLKLASAGTPVTPEQFKTLANQLAQEPGMAYLADLAKRPDIDWQAVSTAHQQWDYKSQGLTQAGAIVLTVVVAIVATPASGWVNTAAVGATGSAAVGAAAGAGFTTLTTSAAVSFANNGGDVGKTLNDLGKDETLKNIVASMLTAGLIKGMAPSSSLPAVTDAGFANRFTTYAAQAAMKAGVQSLVYDKPLTETMKTALIDSLAQSLTNEIGGDWAKKNELNSGSLAKTLAHSVVQCAAASLANKDCGSAAVGAATSELLSPLANRASGSWGNAISSMGAVLAASLLDKDINTAYGAAQMVDNYNRKLHPSENLALRNAAKQLAAKQIAEHKTTSTLTADQRNSLEQYWFDQLEAEAKAKVDVNSNSTRQKYLDQLTAISGESNHAAVVASAYLTDAQLARQVVVGASGGVIYGTDGQAIIADGSILRAFEASAEQYADSQLFLTNDSSLLKKQFGSLDAATNAKALSVRLENSLIESNFNYSNKQKLKDILQPSEGIEAVAPELYLIGSGRLVKSAVTVARDLGKATLSENSGSKVANEIAALEQIGKNPNGQNLADKVENYVLYQQAEKISTAKSWQSTAPRDLNEQTLWNGVFENPKGGDPLPLGSDPRFPKDAGFQKMQSNHQLPDGNNITIHYQYNENTGKAYDVKIVTPQQTPPVLQPGASIKGK